MAIRNVSVTTNAKLVPGSDAGGFPSDVTIVNTGSNTAYVDSDQPDSTTAGQPITAGSSLVWQAGQSLWVIGASATTLTISENAGALFDAGAIASQILTQGLATQIATAVNLQGVPVVDKPTSLYSGNLVVNDLGTGQDTTTAIFDVTKYQSVSVTVSLPSGVTGSTNTRDLGVLWYADLAGTILIDADVFTVSAQQDLSIQALIATLSVRGPYVQFIAYLHTPAYASQTWKVYLNAYLRLLPTKVLINNLLPSSPIFELSSSTGYFAMTGSVPLSTTYTDYPQIYPGPAWLSCYSNNSLSAAARANVFDLVNGTEIANVFLPSGLVGGDSRNTSFILPRRQVGVRMINADTVNARSFHLVLISSTE